MTDFLVDFTRNCGAAKVRGLLRALQRIAANAETRGKVKFGQIFLAAPDVERDLFLNLARLYREHSERTTLYASSADRAVHLFRNTPQRPAGRLFRSVHRCGGHRHRGGPQLRYRLARPRPLRECGGAVARYVRPDPARGRASHAATAFGWRG